MNFEAINIEEVGNYFEAGFWIVVAIALLCGALRSKPQIKRVGCIASLAFGSSESPISSKRKRAHGGGRGGCW